MLGNIKYFLNLSKFLSFRKEYEKVLIIFVIGKWLFRLILHHLEHFKKEFCAINVLNPDTVTHTVI